MAKSKVKSVITCDMEGRIETFNEGAQHIFGYQPEEVIGKKRVSLFSPGQVVLEHVPSWLATASKEGEFESQTVFVNRDGEPIPARVRITPTFKDGVQIGYCGVTEPLDEVDPEAVAPNISLMTKIFTWLVITRAPFLTAMIMPILIGAAWVGARGLASPYPWGLFVLALLAGIFLHVAANTYNDYFDWTSGTDQVNNDYFLPYSGGSRSIELGLIDEKTLFRVATIAMLISAASGLALAVISGWGVLLFGLAGTFLAYFYTAPPLRLAARRGLGELSVGLSFGPLATAGTTYALTGSVSVADFLIGVPIGLLTIAILWINQFPDELADKAAGKINLVVVLGKRRARWGYLALLAAAFGLTLYWIIDGTFPLGAGLILGSLPVGLLASYVLIREYANRSLVRANATTIQMHALAGALMVVGLLLTAFLA
ncbi:MAG: UbiA family prenyltransferase [Anaerolineales bacterium]|nr:UbiA family prenyltransferase [Anaerolineales bacterium]